MINKCYLMKEFNVMPKAHYQAKTQNTIYFNPLQTFNGVERKYRWCMSNLVQCYVKVPIKKITL